MDLTLTPSAAGYALAHGGQIFVWIGSEGLSHVDTREPDSSDVFDWEHERIDDVLVSVAGSPGLSWRIDTRRFPRQRLIVTSNVTRYLPPAVDPPTVIW